MNQYYRILELEPGASEIEVKKAYFQLIRQHSPESDPEGFQKIREAYEQLKEKKAEEGPVFAPLQEPMDQIMLERIEGHRRAGNDKLFRDACQEAWENRPDNLQFLYLLCQAQRSCGNTGKAVKSAQKLVEAEPDNRWFWRELAICYLERGYTKKAWPAFEKAYEQGIRDLDFIQLYAQECDYIEEYERGCEILSSFLSEDRKWSRSELLEYFELLANFLKLAHLCEGNYYSESLERLEQACVRYRTYLSDVGIGLAVLITTFITFHDGLRLEDARRYLHIMALFKETCTERETHVLDRSIRYFQNGRIVKDERLDDIHSYGYEAFIELPDEDDADRETIQYSQTDVMLCMIERRDVIFGQEEILREDYPEYYEAVGDFWDKLRDEKNLPFLKSKLKKTLNRMSAYFPEPYYYKYYPDENPAHSHIVVADGSQNAPYVRSSKKIGRNDPCPCGSGKKYKQCCMKK